MMRWPLMFVLAAALAAAAPAVVNAQSQIPIGTRVGESPSGYDEGRRRDPFVSLIVPKPSPASKPAAGITRPATGLGAVSVTDVVVKGVVRSGTTLIALLQGPDGRTFLARRQDRLQDGVVARIDTDGVVFNERTADAAGVVRARDVRKPLRSAASGGL